MKHVNLEKWKEPVEKLTKMLTENSPTILTVFGSVGLVTTVGLAIRTTVSAARIMDEHKDEIEQIPQKQYKAAEAVRLTWKCYVPVTIVGGASLGCIIGANSINLKRNAALMAAYITTEDKLKGCQSWITEAVTGKSEKKDGDESEKKDNKPLIFDGRKCLCKDEFSGRLFETTLSRIRTAESRLNQMMTYEYRVTVNELYDELDLERIEAAEHFGWDLERGDQVQISIDAEMNEQHGPIMLITYDPKHYWNG